MRLYHSLVVSERAKLCRIATLFALGSIQLVGLGCQSISAAPHPSYETSSRRLVRLDVDADADGFVEQRTYLNGNVPLRTEVDGDRDGRIDRWEYVDGRANVVKVGASSANDGREDQWIYPSTADGEQRVDRSTERTGRVDRREFYRAGAIDRAEEDTNQDGVIDKWERFESGVLREVAYDTTRTAGRADRRLIYDAQGKFVRLEADPDGDNQFAVVEAGATQAVDRK
jgi:hypothetical protein